MPDRNRCQHLNTGCCLQAAYAKEHDLRLDLEAELTVMRSQLAAFRSQVVEARIAAGQYERQKATCYVAGRADTARQQLEAALLALWVIWVGGMSKTAATKVLRRHSPHLPTQQQLLMQVCLTLQRLQSGKESAWQLTPSLSGSRLRPCLAAACLPQQGLPWKSTATRLLKFFCLQMRWLWSMAKRLLA